MILGGAELLALWAAVFLAALVDSALHSLSWSRLEEELKRREARQRYARYVKHTRLFSLICLAVRVAAAVALIGLITQNLIGSHRSLALSLSLVAALLALVELAARTIGQKWSAAVLRAFLPLFHLLSWPLRILPLAEEPDAHVEGAPKPGIVQAAKEEIRVAIEDGAVEGALDNTEKEMIKGVLKFQQVDVAQIMTPRTEIESLDAGLPLSEALDAFYSFRHSRIPVFEGTLDRVAGIVYVKDVLAAARQESRDSIRLRDIMREPFFAPETQSVGHLLQKLQERHIQIAIVLDEYGGVSGVVSVEDVIEEIVGEIQDEYDEEDHESWIKTLPSGAIETDARVRIDELNADYDLNLPEDNGYDTVAGFVTSRFGRVPGPDEELRTDDLLIRVLQSDERRVHRVLLEPIPRRKE